MSTATSRRFPAGHVTATCVACALGLALLGAPRPAAADPMSDLQEVQSQISEANAAYSEANAQVEQLQAKIEENQARIAELEVALPAQRERASDSIRTLYKMQQGSGSLVDLILSSESFYDLVTTIQYLDVIQAHNTDAVDELAATAQELESAQQELSQQMDEAESQRQAASDALASASSARSQLQAQIDAQAAAEEAERQAAVEAAQKEAEEQKGATFTTESGEQTEIEAPSSPDPGNVDWNSDKQAFVSEWGGRIDAFLAGSPLAGQGRTFAEAAWEYGVDPRFSPAISLVESSRGTYCFRPHNAWGWGSSSWDTWEEAIWDHVAGLAAGYGGQLTLAGAYKYCPPNAQFWYSKVLATMERI